MVKGTLLGFSLAIHGEAGNDIHVGDVTKGMDTAQELAKLFGDPSSPVLGNKVSNSDDYPVAIQADSLAFLPASPANVEQSGRDDQLVVTNARHLHDKLSTSVIMTDIKILFAMENGANTAVPRSPSLARIAARWLGSPLRPTHHRLSAPVPERTVPAAPTTATPASAWHRARQATASASMIQSDARSVQAGDGVEGAVPLAIRPVDLAASPTLVDALAGSVGWAVAAVAAGRV